VSLTDPHKYAECSAKGTCDRDTGLCTCVDGYTGTACERSACPADCSGHGKCRLVRDLTSGYALWDANKIQGCVCDGGYTGADCAQRLCPKGDDPLSICNSANAHQVQAINVRGSPRATFGAFTNGYSAVVGSGATATRWTYKGDLAIHFTDNTGEEWITNKVADIFSVSSAAGVKKALQALPNYRIPAVAVADAARDSTTRTILVTFDNDRVSGNQKLFTFDSPLGCQVAGCHPKYNQPQLTTISTLSGSGTSFIAATPADPINWLITDDSVFDTSLIAAGDKAAAGTFGSSTFRARVTVYPSLNGDALTASKLPAHAYKVDWDLNKHYGTGGSETYFVHLYGTKVSDDTTFTLTFRGRTTEPIAWGGSTTLTTARDDPIQAALEKVEMELGGTGATTVTCFAGFDPTPAGNGFSTAFGVNTAYCTIKLNKLASGVVASDLIVTPSFGTLSVNPGASSGKYAEIAITGLAAISLAGKTSTGDDCGVGADTTPDIYANTATTFQGSVLVVCASSSDTTPKVFYSSPTGERIAVSGANLAGSAALATFTHQVTTLTSSEFDSGVDTFTLSYGGVPVTTPIALTGAIANENKNLIQAELDTSYGAGTFTVTEDATKKIFTVTNLKPALSALTVSAFTAAVVTTFTITAATTTPEVGLPGARVQKLVVNGPTTSGGGLCTIRYAATATAVMSPGVTAGTLQAALNAGASNHFTVTSPAANTYLITYAFTASPSSDAINTFACTGADSTTTGVITTVTNEVLSGTVSGKRVQTLTITANTASGAATTFANLNCKISYAGATTGFIATKAATDVAAALNALGKGSFSVGGNAGPDIYTITYDSPSPLGVLSDFVCTDTTKVGTFAITSELALFNDGYTYLNDDTEFTVTAISKRTLPDTRDATTGAGRSKVPIGYGMYLSIPAVYYNAAWNTAAVANAAGGVPFTVLITVDIGTASASLVTSASVDVEDAECSNRGHCDRTTGTCACYEGYYGDHCGKQTILV